MTCREEVAPGGGGPNILTTVPQVPVRTVDTNSPPPGINFIVWSYMNRQERLACWNSTTECRAVTVFMGIATAVDGLNRYTESFAYSGDDCSPRNAFKHAYWNAMMTVNLGVDIAKKWADLHEIGNDGSGDKCPYPSRTGEIYNPSSKMDYHNNAVGRQVGIEVMMKLGYPNPFNNGINALIQPYLLPATMVALERGRLVTQCEVYDCGKD